MSVVILVIDRIGRLNTNNHTYNDIHVTIIVKANHKSGFRMSMPIYYYKLYICYNDSIKVNLISTSVFYMNLGLLYKKKLGK